MNISCSKWSDFGWPGCICQYCACLAIMSNRVCKRRFVVQFPHRAGGTSENLGGQQVKQGLLMEQFVALIWPKFGGGLGQICPLPLFFPGSAGPTSYIDRFNSRSFLIEDDYYTAYHNVSYPLIFILCNGII